MRVLPLLLRILNLWRLVVPLLITGLGLMVLAATARAEGFQDMDAIIRSLAPIEYLPEHQSLAKGKQRSIVLNILFKLNSSVLIPDAERLETIDWGEERLKVPFNPSDAINRRIEIVALGPFSKREPPKGSPMRETRQKRIIW